MWKFQAVNDDLKKNENRLRIDQRKEWTKNIKTNRTPHCKGEDAILRLGAAISLQSESSRIDQVYCWNWRREGGEHLYGRDEVSQSENTIKWDGVERLRPRAMSVQRGGLLWQTRAQYDSGMVPWRPHWESVLLSGWQLQCWSQAGVISWRNFFNLFWFPARFTHVVKALRINQQSTCYLSVRTLRTVIL